MRFSEDIARNLMVCISTLSILFMRFTLHQHKPIC